MAFAIFAERDLYTHLASLAEDLKHRVAVEPPEYLLRVNDGEYLAYLESHYKIEPLVFGFDSVSVSDREEFVPGGMFPGGGFAYNVQPGRKYRKPVIRYHLPFSGDAMLLHCIPSNRIVWTIEVEIVDGCVCFDIVDFSANASEVKAQGDSTLKNIRQQSDNVNQQVLQHNEGLRAIAIEAIRRRRGELERRSSVLASLGVPIRKSKSIPETFVVPQVRKKIITKPAIQPTTGPPAPTLDEEVYREILRTVYEMGKTFERYPHTYVDKSEEALRDHLILQLEPRFEGSTTGETFNKSGKTDILIRYEKNNVFVAECKFWDGKAQHFKTIDQILSYLTWRDSKTAIVYFVNRKEISPILAEIATQTSQHSCFVSGPKSTKDPSWQEFEFHLPSDSGCKIRLTVLAFHIPPK